MKIFETNIKDVLIIEPKIHRDDRGYFTEIYRKDLVEAHLGVQLNFCQDNESKSLYGALRGLHFQLPPFAQSKLVNVIQGRALDVAVDIREGSPTFGQHVAVELTAENKKQMFVPRGFAHGFVVLSKEATFCYKVDNYYNAESERGIAFNDKTLDINWAVDHKDLILSAKDKALPTLKEAEVFSYHNNLYE